MKKKILFIYRTPRKKVLKLCSRGKAPDSLLFGYNYILNLGYDADFFDDAYKITNIYHPMFYPLEHAIIAKIGMGFKLDQALYLLPKLNSYDVIVATGDSAGLPILALKHYGLIKKPVIFMTAGLAGALKGKESSWVASYYKKILRIPEVFTAYSQVEIDFFEKEMKIPKRKVQYMPLGTDWNYFSKKANIKRTIISAVGVDSGRDYKTFFEAVCDLPYRVEIACHPSNIKDLEIPQNVKVYINASIKVVRDIFNRSILTVVPCFERFRSAGQMVLLEASSASLPIVASEIKGITGAFQFQNKKHLLFTRPEDGIDLKEKIIFLLNNKKFATALGKNASNFVKNNYTTQHLAINLAQHIDNLS